MCVCVYNDHLSYKRVLAVLQYMVWLYLIKHLYFIVNYIKMTLTSRPAKVEEVRPVYNTPEMRSVGSVFSSCPQREPKHTNSKHWDCRFVYLVFFCCLVLVLCSAVEFLICCGYFCTWQQQQQQRQKRHLWLKPELEARVGSASLVQFQMHADICDALLHCMTTRGVLLQI